MKQVSKTKNLLFAYHSINARGLFPKYRLILTFAAIALFISSCRKEDNPCKKSVPFKAVFQVQAVTSQVGPILHVEAAGTGEATPGGKSSFVGHAQVDSNNIFTDNGTITTANGDQIFETTKGPGPVVDATTGNILIISHNIITGGTGRFEGATGNYTTIAHASVFTPAGVDSLKGTVILDECHRKLTAQ